MKKIAFLLLLPTLVFAQNSDRKFIGYKKTKDALDVVVSDGIYRLKIYSDDIVETTFLPLGKPTDVPSYAVVMQPKEIGKVSDSKTELTLTTKALSVTVTKSPFQIAYRYNGKLLLSEKHGFSIQDSIQSVDFNLDPAEALTGGGARAVGLNRRGHKLKLRNEAHYGYGDYADQLNFCIPLVVSSKKYAVHFDNPAIATLDLDSGKNNTMTYATGQGRYTYQVIAGQDWKALLDHYTDLTGKQPLPPRWVFGNFASRFGYRSQEAVEGIVRRFEQDSIPLDAVILDLYWFGKTIKGTMGNLDWDRDNFPEPEKMLSDLNRKQLKTVLITEPFVLTTSSKWSEADAQKVLATGTDGKSSKYDFYFGNTGIVDVFKPEGQQWFWNIYKKFTAQGVGGWWGDLGEPEKLPEKVNFAAGNATLLHNVYGHQWAKLIADGYRRDFPNERPFILMRAGYSGTQRYGIIPWSGDVSRSWNGFKSQPEIALGMGVQGIGYMHSDLGGFAGDYNDNELYLRWLQYGVFQPVFRPHAHEDVASEVARKDVVTKAKAKKLVELRYRLLPYNYSTAYENATHGTPLMRPLFFEEPDNAALFGNSKTYLWGDAFLVTPIVEPNAKTAAVYFPKNDNWFDFYSDEKHVGGKAEKVSVADDHLPVYVRGNSFVPMADAMQNTAAYSLAHFTVHFYFDAGATMHPFTLYHDDGKTPDAECKGQSEKIDFQASEKGVVLTIAINDGVQQNFTATDKSLTLVVHALSQAKNVSVNGKSVTFKAVGNTLEIPVTLEKGARKVIKIER